MAQARERRARQIVSDETGTAQSSSGVVDPDREKVLAEARAERAANKRELHPWATKDAE